MSRSSSYISSFSKLVRFTTKCMVFMALAFGYFLHVMPQYEGSYCAGLIDKVARLKSIEEPKLVLIGNSNLSFGIDSEYLQQEIGMPVVNMGLHGGLGNIFHEEMAKLNIQEGDIYVLCHSGYIDTADIPDPVLAWLTVEDHSDLWPILRMEDVPVMAEAYPTYLKRCLNLYSTGTGNADDGSLYSRSAFNEYGDVATHRAGNHFEFKNPIKPPAIEQSVVDRLNELWRYLDERGAALLISCHPVANGRLTADAQNYGDFTSELKDMLKADVISDYRDYMLDYGYFYNSGVHLTTEAARLRTEQLAKDIKEWQERIPGSGSGEDSSDSADGIMLDRVLDLPRIDDIAEYEAEVRDIGSRLVLLGSEKGNRNAVFIISGTDFENFNGILTADHELNGATNEMGVYHISSSEDNSSIMIDGIERSFDQPGMNVIVFDVVVGRIVDRFWYEGNSSSTIMR